MTASAAMSVTSDGTMAMETALASDSLITWALPVAPHDPKKTKKLRQKHQAKEEAEPSAQVQDVISRFIPKREWTDASGTLWVQEASPQPASRLDAVVLGERLDAKLKEVAAKPTGICPDRSLLYQECFSELLRQITADSVERGILLHKVREERNTTVAAYQGLLESRAGYAFRTALKGEKDAFRIKCRIEELRAKKAELVQEEQSLKEAEQKVKAEGEEMLKEEEKRRKDEIAVLQKESQMKKVQLEALVSIPKK